MSDPQALHAELLRRSDDWLDVVLSPQPFAAAVKAVLELHKPYPDGKGGVECLRCELKGWGRLNPEWPCETVKVISSALGVTTDGRAQ